MVQRLIEGREGGGGDKLAEDHFSGVCEAARA